MRWLVAWTVLACGCTSRDVPNSSQPLIVGAPASLREPFEGIVQAFKLRHPETSASLIFGAPAQLLESGVPLDVIAADSSDLLAPLAARLNPGERRDYASNPLCLVARSGAAEAHLKTLAVTPWVQKIGLADGRGGDSAGLGAEAALGRLGLRRALNERLSYMGTGTMVLEQLAKGALDVGFAFSADVGTYNAAHPEAPLQIADRVADDPHARYPIAIFLGTPRLAAARQFVDEVLHGEGQKLFADKGLLPPRAD